MVKSPQALATILNRSTKAEESKVIGENKRAEGRTLNDRVSASFGYNPGQINKGRRAQSDP